MGEARITKKLTGLAIIVLMDQNPARQDPKRTLDDAHVLIQHEVMVIGAVKQRADG
jgi:hypothetical protein